MSSNTSVIRRCNMTLYPDRICPNNSSPRPSPTHHSGLNFDCYSCTGACVYKCVELMFIIGIIANLIVLLRVICDKTLRKPTFVAIACLAFSDFVFLSINITVAIEVVVRSISCTLPPRVADHKIVVTSIGTSWFVANGHITFMAVVRYILLTNPLKAHIYLTNVRIIIMSVCVWVFGTVLFVARHLIGEYIYSDAANSPELATITWCVVYLMPLTVTVILHVAKIRRVRHATKDSATVYTRASIKRMSKIVLLLICFATILPLPKFVYVILDKINYDYPSPDIKTNLRNIVVFLFYFNSCVNPFVYALISTAFKNSIKRMCLKGKTTNVLHNTNSTIASSRKCEKGEEMSDIIQIQSKSESDKKTIDASVKEPGQ